MAAELHADELVVAPRQRRAGRGLGRGRAGAKEAVGLLLAPEELGEGGGLAGPDVAVCVCVCVCWREG